MRLFGTAIPLGHRLRTLWHTHLVGSVDLGGIEPPSYTRAHTDFVIRLG